MRARACVFVDSFLKSIRGCRAYIRGGPSLKNQKCRTKSFLSRLSTVSYRLPVHKTRVEYVEPNAITSRRKRIQLNTLAVKFQWSADYIKNECGFFIRISKLPVDLSFPSRFQFTLISFCSCSFNPRQQMMLQLLICFSNRLVPTGILRHSIALNA